MATESYQHERLEMIYDELADSFDEITEQDRWNSLVDGLMIRTFCSRKRLPVNRWLDVGPGTGALSTKAARKPAPEAAVTAVELSSNMLAELSQRPELAGKVQPVHSSIEAYVEDWHGSFDVITAMGCLEFVPDMPDHLRRLISHLGQGAVLGMTYRTTDQARPQRLSQRSGLTKVEYDEYLYPRRLIDDTLGNAGLDIVHNELVENVYLPTPESPAVNYQFIAAVKP